MSISTGARPRTSSTCTSRSFCTETSPFISSGRPGSVVTRTPAVRQCSTMSRRTAPGADGMAMITSRARVSRRIRVRSSRDPSTFTPPTRRPFLRGSSSTSPTGVYASAALARMSRSSEFAAFPAPHTMTGRPFAMPAPRDARSITERTTKRTPPMSTTVKRKSSANTPRGTASKPSGRHRVSARVTRPLATRQASTICSRSWMPVKRHQRV